MEDAVMASATASPDKIRKQLDELWTKLGEQSDQTDGVLRACSLSFIVATPVDAGLAPMLGELMHAHPARAIVVTLASDSAQPLDAQVQAECWLPFGRKQQICCERIEVSAGLDAAAHMPALVRALAAPDLPVIIYHRGAHGLPATVLAEMTAQADKVIIDSVTVANFQANLASIRHLGVGGRRVADLAWTRLTRWRAMIAQFFDDPAQLARLKGIHKISIEWEGEMEPVSTYYLQAWLEHSLERRLERSSMRTGPSERCRVRSVRLSGEGIDLAVTVAQDRSAHFAADGQRRATIMPLLSECELLSEELSILGADPTYEGVLDHLPRLLG
jgi:glucose-6-phosphate dehydrogenase assembly protein OpcA